MKEYHAKFTLEELKEVYKKLESAINSGDYLFAEDLKGKNTPCVNNEDIPTYKIKSIFNFLANHLPYQSEMEDDFSKGCSVTYSKMDFTQEMIDDYFSSDLEKRISVIEEKLGILNK